MRGKGIRGNEGDNEIKEMMGRARRGVALFCFVMDCALPFWDLGF
jgi:hypothetical protein